MQVEPIKPTLKAPGSKRLKLEHGKLLSIFAFNFNLRRYSVVREHEDELEKERAAAAARAGAYTRPHLG